MPPFFDNIKKAVRIAGRLIGKGYAAEQEMLQDITDRQMRFDALPDTLKKALSEEPLAQQFRRFASRLARAANYQPIEPQDLNVIKLPEDKSGRRFFAKRNAQGNWNVWQRTGHAQGAEPIVDTLIVMDVKIGEALNTLAAKNPQGMKEKTYMHWHPAHVATRIGHAFPGELGHKIPVPQDLLPPPRRKGHRPPR